MVIEGSLPNLAWFIRDLANGKGLEVCPMLNVTKTLSSPGGMQIITRHCPSLTKLFPFVYKGQSAVSIRDDSAYSLNDIVVLRTYLEEGLWICCSRVFHADV